MPTGATYGYGIARDPSTGTVYAVLGFTDPVTVGGFFAIPTLVSYLSSVCPLEPGDLIFTGTPDGVGMARGRFLTEGDVVVSGAEGIGQLRNTCVSGKGPFQL